jgi:polysaccharide biosynthesis/export protein
MGRAERVEQERPEEGQPMMGNGKFSQGWMKKRALTAGLILLLTAAVTSPLRAQFSGPAVKLPSEPNLVPVPTNDPALLQPQNYDIHIDLGDVLTIHVFGSLEFLPTVKVSADGTIQIPLVGVVPVAGLTVSRAEDVIAERLVNAGMYKNPQVTVDITSAVNHFATVTGELHAIVPLFGVRRLLDVLASSTASGSGGVSANANITSSVLASSGGWPSTASHIITIIRQGEPKPIVVDLGTDPLRSAAANIVILPHDLIVVSKVGVVYMVGAFARQGAIPLDQNTPLTLLQASALSGGVGFEGKFQDLRIIRTEGAKREVVKVDVKRVLHGKDPDPILQADDIVFLPTNNIKAALKGNGIQTLTSVAEVAILALQR